MWTFEEISHYFFALATLIMIISKYQAGALDRIDDPEPEVTWTPPKNPHEFKDFVVGADYSGLLYAGTVEFNWIVDMRVLDADQEDWSTGNLVSAYHVITTNNALYKLVEASGDLRDKLQDPDYPDWKVSVFRHDPTGIRINYCDNYLWPVGGPTDYDTDWRVSGSRSVKKTVTHPMKETGKLSFDVSIVVLNRGIPAIEPRAGFMPTGFDYVRGEIKEMIVLDPNKAPTFASPVCYVASFGRNYVNHKEFYVLDYKTKLRVYITHWADCQSQWSYVCNSENDEDCADGKARSGVEYLMCMRPRAKVGTVCDHDRGAPVVCNGQVIALVVRGPKFKHCNNLYKIPFIAEKISHYREFFDDSIKYVVKPVPRKVDPITNPPSPYARASSLAFGKLTCIVSFVISMYFEHI